MHADVEGPPPVGCVGWPRLEHGVDGLDDGLTVEKAQALDGGTRLRGGHLEEGSVPEGLYDDEGDLVHVESAFQREGPFVSSLIRQMCGLER